MAVHNLSSDRILPRPLIGVLDKFGGKSLPNDSQIGIGEYRKQSVFGNAVKGAVLVKHDHSLHVQVPKIVVQLSLAGQILIAVQGGHKFIVRIRVIKMVLLHPAGTEDPLKTLPAESSHTAPVHIVLKAGVIGPQVVLLAARKIL